MRSRKPAIQSAPYTYTCRVGQQYQDSVGGFHPGTPDGCGFATTELLDYRAHQLAQHPEIIVGTPEWQAARAILDAGFAANSKCDRCHRHADSYVSFLGDRDLTLCPECAAAHRESEASLDAKIAATEAAKSKSAHACARCGKAAVSYASTGWACANHYDSMS